jgi:hypothetical protein
MGGGTTLEVAQSLKRGHRIAGSPSGKAQDARIIGGQELQQRDQEWPRAGHLRKGPGLDTTVNRERAQVVLSFSKPGQCADREKFSLGYRTNMMGSRQVNLRLTNLR